MPTFIIACNSCGHEHETKSTCTYGQAETMRIDFKCQRCGWEQASIVPTGGHFHLKHDKSSPDKGGWTSRGR